MKVLFFITVFCLAIAMHLYSQPPKGFKSLTAKAFKELLDSSKPILIDVRTAEEFASGHIKDAVNIDVNSPDFATRVQSVAKQNAIALYCRSGRRSKIAASKITSLQLVISELNEGVIGWKNAGFELISTEQK